jgi:YD repeat-containing protein
LTYRSVQGEFTLIWDAAGQLAQVRQGQREVAAYQYDAQGRRIAKTLPGDASQNRRFLYDGDQLIAETDAQGRITRQYVYLGQRVVAWIEPAQGLVEKVKQYFTGPKVVYLHTDHRGAVSAATDGDRHVLWQARWDVTSGSR